MATKQRKIIAFTSLSWLLIIIGVPHLNFIPQNYLTKVILALITITYITCMPIYAYQYLKIKKSIDK